MRLGLAMDCQLSSKLQHAGNCCAHRVAHSMASTELNYSAVNVLRVCRSETHTQVDTSRQCDSSISACSMQHQPSSKWLDTGRTWVTNCSSLLGTRLLCPVNLDT